MSIIKKVIHSALSTIVAVLTIAVTAYSEQVKGNLKSLAVDAQVFTIESVQGKVFLINYNKSTQWVNLTRPGEMEANDFLIIEFTRKGEQAIAGIVTKAIAIPPAGIASITTGKLALTLDQNVTELPFILIDSRPVELFDAAHLPGAISIPVSRLEKRSLGLLPENMSAHLIFYDQGAGGSEAKRCTDLAKKAGFSNITIYPDGIAGWLKSGRVAASSAAFIRKNRPIIIDLRPEEIVANGHLEGAVNLPANKLPEMRGMFLMNKRSPIVLYANNNQQALAAARTIRDWGFLNVTIFIGGITDWLESAEVLSVEPAEKFMPSTAMSHSGRIDANDFEKALFSPGTVEIVDVRSSADYSKGKFTVGKHIPLQDLPLRHGELTKDMIQVIFAADEQHAEMAYDFLRQLGYRLNYLHGSVYFDKDGKHQIR